MAAIVKVANAYNQMANNKPLLTNCVTGFILASLGDIACQKWIEGPARAKNVKKLPNYNFQEKKDSEHTAVAAFHWDARRTLEMGVIRAAVIAPFIHVYYPFLASLFPSTQFRYVLGRVILDQFLGSPIVIGLVFFSSAILQGRPLAVFQRIREKGFATWMRGLQYWPFVHSLTFGVIPAVHRTLWAHVCSIYWNAVLSFYANMKLE
jgi:hypothetical protein